VRPGDHGLAAELLAKTGVRVAFLSGRGESRL
jgi:hypothetical protein